MFMNRSLSRHGPGRIVSVRIQDLLALECWRRRKGEAPNYESISMVVFRRRCRDYAFAYGIGRIPSLSTTAKTSIHTRTQMGASSNHRGFVSTRIRLDAQARGIRCSGYRKGRSTSPTLINLSCLFAIGIVNLKGEDQQYSRDSNVFSFLRPEGLRTFLHYANLA